MFIMENLLLAILSNPEISTLIVTNLVALFSKPLHKIGKK